MVINRKSSNTIERVSRILFSYNTSPFEIPIDGKPLKFTLRFLIAFKNDKQKQRSHKSLRISHHHDVPEVSDVFSTSP